MRRTAFFLLALCWTACLAHAQRLAGSVTDTHGAAIPGATVRLTGSGFEVTATTDSDGRFEMADDPGAHTITFEAQGFETFRRPRLITQFEVGELSATLRPKPVDDTEIVLISVADTASGRPQYLAGAGLWPGAPFVATGLFRATSTIEVSGDPPTELDGLKIEFSSDGGVVLAPILLVSPDQVKGIVPTDLANGTWTMTVKRGDEPSRGGPIRIGANHYAPHIFTQNGLGFGTALATDEAGNPITFVNPVRPGGVADIRIVTPAGANEFHGQLLFSRRLAATPLAADALGQSIVRVNIPGDLTARETGCAVPFRMGWTIQTGAIRYGNQATLPISTSGPCTDALGFGPADFPLLGAAGIKIAEVSITEGTLLSTNRRDGTFGRLTANQWGLASYSGVAPVNSCNYRWEPAGFRNPNAPTSLAPGGTASTTVPWGQFNFSAASNAGPFSLAFANPANFAEGSYSANFPAGFTVGGAPHTFQATGSYRRPAGRVRDFVASRAAQAGFWSGQTLGGYLDRVIQAIIDAPPADVSQVFADVNIVADDDSKGRHLIRCISDPAEPAIAEHSALLKRIFGDVLPGRTNRTDVTIRFLPKEQIRHNHSNSAVDRTHLTFDSFITIQVNGNR